jgi:hypothetical protein
LSCGFNEVKALRCEKSESAAALARTKVDTQTADRESAQHTHKLHDMVAHTTSTKHGTKKSTKKHLRTEFNT